MGDVSIVIDAANKFTGSGEYKTVVTLELWPSALLFFRLIQCAFKKCPLCLKHTITGPVDVIQVPSEQIQYWQNAEKRGGDNG